MQVVYFGIIAVLSKILYSLEKAIESLENVENAFQN